MLPFGPRTSSFRYIKLSQLGDMPTTINCVECGKLVSDYLQQCPHCHGNPRAVCCEECKISVPCSQATKYWLYQHPEFYICSKCKSQAEQKIQDQVDAITRRETATCPACSTRLSNTDFPFTFEMIDGRQSVLVTKITRCPICGHGLNALNCNGCGLPMLQLSGVTIDRVCSQRIESDTGRDLGYGIRNEKITVHNNCVPKIKYLNYLYSKKYETLLGIPHSVLFGIFVVTLGVLFMWLLSRCIG